MRYGRVLFDAGVAGARATARLSHARTVRHILRRPPARALRSSGSFFSPSLLAAPKLLPSSVPYPPSSLGIRPRLKPFREGILATFRKTCGTLVPASEKPSQSRKNLPRQIRCRRKENLKIFLPAASEKPSQSLEGFSDVILFFTQSQYKYFSHFSC